MNHEEPVTIDGGESPLALLNATRALLWVTSGDEARDVATTLVRALGGSVVPAEDVQGDALPIDLSFGAGAALLPCAPRGSVAATLLQRHLPSFALDARRALEVYSEVHRFSVDASTDSLTQLPNRRMVTRVVSRLRTGDTVIMLDLDHFKRINDTYGHPTGDETLRQLGKVLRESVRERDFAGRYGGEEFIIVLSDAKDPDAFLTRLRDAWWRVRPFDVSFSAGIAIAREDPTLALGAADRALYEAKSDGRDRWIWASDEVLDGSRPHDRREPAVASFVSVIAIDVRSSGALDVDGAVAEYFGVEHWPGCLHHEVWQDVADPSQVTVSSWWVSRENYDAFVTSHDRRRDDDPSRLPVRQSDVPPLRTYRVITR